MSTESSADTPRPAVFRTPLVALIAIVFLALCLSPVAFLGGFWFLLFLLPIGAAWWVVRGRTVVDTDGVGVRTPWGSTRWPWSRVATLRLVDRGWVRAVGTGDGEELVLRGVRIHHLARIGDASGGRITVPSPAEARDAAEHRRELEAARMRIARLREAQGEEAAPETSETSQTPDGQDADEPTQDRA